MKTIFSVLVVIVLGTSCEKVINVDLEEAEKKYVIEGEVSNVPGAASTVKISQTKKFEEENVFAGITGATVTIQVNEGITYPLPETSTGIYTTTAFTGTPGSLYKLTVSLNGTVFTATSTMPAQIVSLDTLRVVDFTFGETLKTIEPDYQDPLGLGNSYRFIEYANGVQVKRVFVQDDEVSDGLRITTPLINPDGELESGDVVKVDMLCIDTDVYKYWYSLDQAATGSSNVTPANPVSNISGGALGYFSAHSVTSKTIVVP
ncbi:DUF4249 domain-containing protein [Pseudoflavitalea sp. X16]|uniref:DUF4249 domain-containing protein n=1 Tax=Paraflavitalea devenefica TaxID=2716334 RepID=UPI00141EAC20|nr:DUF4249 domain-containing protein [Paraflavitalea devenefica]NII26100.1 DUF4249 domain-containing protein [Paraflavitalea devenefica]